MAVPMASPEPYRSPAQSSMEPCARLSDDLGLVRAEVERQLARAPRAVSGRAVTQFVMLRAEREVRRGLQAKSERDARPSTSRAVSPFSSAGV